MQSCIGMPMQGQSGLRVSTAEYLPYPPRVLDVLDHTDNIITDNSICFLTAHTNG